MSYKTPQTPGPISASPSSPKSNLAPLAFSPTPRRGWPPTRGEGKAAASAVAKKKTAIPDGKRARGSSSSHARKKKVYEPLSGEDTSSESSGPLTGVPELVRFHIEIAQIDIRDYMKGMTYKFNKYVDARMKRLREEIWHELDAESISGN